MRRITYFFVVIMTMCLFTSCASNDDPLHNNAKFYEQTRMTFNIESGLYYLHDDESVWFYDFASKQSTIACNKPNCKHKPWNSSTPEEQRCSAYHEFLPYSGFEKDGQNYIFEYNPIDNTASLVRSELDCSNQTVIAKLETDTCRYFAVIGDTLYMPCDLYVFEPNEEGLPQMTGEIYTWLNSIDLNSGKITEITERVKAYNSNLRMVCIDGSALFFEYTFFEEHFDGYNFESAKLHNELYKYNINTGEYSKVEIAKKTEDMAAILICGSKAVIIEKIKWPDMESRLVEVNLESGERTIFCELASSVHAVDNCVHYETDNGAFYYNVETGETTAIDMAFSTKAGFYFSSVTDDYIFSQFGDERILLSKQDYFAGNPNFIRIDGEENDL